MARKRPPPPETDPPDELQAARERRSRATLAAAQARWDRMRQEQPERWGPPEGEPAGVGATFSVEMDSVLLGQTLERGEEIRRLRELLREAGIDPDDPDRERGPPVRR